jgi:hypothetical protein
MLNAPPGRFPTLRRAGRLDPHRSWPYWPYTIDGIRRVPPVIDKM